MRKKNCAVLFFIVQKIALQNAKLVTMNHTDDKLGQTNKLSCDPSQQCVPRHDTHCLAKSDQGLVRSPGKLQSIVDCAVAHTVQLTVIASYAKSWKLVLATHVTAMLVCKDC